MKIQVLIERRRLIIQACGWSLIDLDLLTPLRKTPVRQGLRSDPHGTVAALVEQADEPPAGLGFGFGTCVARGDIPADRKD